MQEKRCEFTFDAGVDMETVERILLLAVVSVEGIHGRARVRLDADYDSDLASSTCRVNADNEVGQDICRVFTEFLSLEIGEDLFSVRCCGSGDSCREMSVAEGEGQ